MPDNDFDLYCTFIIINGRRGVGIADPCNALELYVLYFGFLLCLPASYKRLLLFTIGGFLMIFCLNILRCVGLIYLNLYQNTWAGFAHHYLFKLIVYAAVFGGWVWYSKKLKS
jgi:exosortase/archaeosortase family protein